MAAIIERVPGAQIKNQEERLQRFLKERNVISVEITPNLNCDGTLEPIGSTFAEGFRMRINNNAPHSRARFSVAHEVCHTFFYELVPEIKFRAHGRDDQEERLCNFGAAVLLIPAKPLRATARKMPVCLTSLERLAQDYCVSLPTMLIRLKSLGLWDCELSNWYRNVGGGFALDRLYGGRQVEWVWHDPFQLERAWHSSASVFGTGFVYLTDPHGVRRYKPISYNMRRTAAGVTTLWGVGIRRPARILPLLESERGRR